MTKLNAMKDAPRDGTDILALYAHEKKPYWTVVFSYNDSPRGENWRSDGEWYTENELLGWISVPEIPQEFIK